MNFSRPHIVCMRRHAPLFFIELIQAGRSCLEPCITCLVLTRSRHNLNWVPPNTSIGRAREDEASSTMCVTKHALPCIFIHSFDPAWCSRLWYRRLPPGSYHHDDFQCMFIHSFVPVWRIQTVVPAVVPRVIPLHVNSFFIVDKPIMIG